MPAGMDGRHGRVGKEVEKVRVEIARELWIHYLLLPNTPTTQPHAVAYSVLTSLTLHVCIRAHVPLCCVARPTSLS